MTSRPLPVCAEVLERRILFVVEFATLDENGVLKITGTDAADTIAINEVRGASGVFVTVAQMGEDTLDFNTDSITRIEIRSGLGDDVIEVGGAGGESSIFKPIYIDCGDGIDQVVGSFGNDTIEGGPGNDVIDSSHGDDSVWGGDGDDKVAGGDGADTLSGGAQRDTVDGGLGNDRLNGNGGHDRLFGNGGADRLYGYEGNDYLDGSSSGDRLEGGGGIDTHLGQSGNDRFFAKDGAFDYVFGGSDSDTALIDPSDELASIETSTT